MFRGICGQGDLHTPPRPLTALSPQHKDLPLQKRSSAQMCRRPLQPGKGPKQNFEFRSLIRSGPMQQVTRDRHVHFLSSTPHSSRRPILRSLSCRVCQFRNLVMASAGFSVPNTFMTRTLPSPTSRCNQRSRNSRWRIFPKPRLDTKLFAAELSVQASATGDTGTPNSDHTFWAHFARKTASIRA